MPFFPKDSKTKFKDSVFVDPQIKIAQSARNSLRSSLGQKKQYGTACSGSGLLCSDF